MGLGKRYKGVVGHVGRLSTEVDGSNFCVYPYLLRVVSPTSALLHRSALLRHCVQSFNVTLKLYASFLYGEYNLAYLFWACEIWCETANVCLVTFTQDYIFPGASNSFMPRNGCYMIHLWLAFLPFECGIPLL